MSWKTKKWFQVKDYLIWVFFFFFYLIRYSISCKRLCWPTAYLPSALIPDCINDDSISSHLAIKWTSNFGLSTIIKKSIDSFCIFFPKQGVFAHKYSILRSTYAKKKKISFSPIHFKPLHVGLSCAVCYFDWIAKFWKVNFIQIQFLLLIYLKQN